MTTHTHNGRKIITAYDLPPHPSLDCTWSAAFANGKPFDPIGRGATEKEAIADPIEKVEE